MSRFRLALMIALVLGGLTACGGGSAPQTPVPTPRVSLSPASLTFVAQTVGTTSPAQSVTLTNVGSAALSVPNFTVSGDFEILNNTCLSSLAVNANCSFGVAFTPTLGGSRSGVLTIADNASNSPQTLTLSGTGLGPTAILSPTSLTFSGQPVGATSPAQTVTLTNTGATSLEINTIAPDGDFAITNNSCGASLAINDSCSFGVTFTPTAIGSRAGAISLLDNAADSPQTIPLSGTGLGPIASLSPATLTFSGQVVGTTSPAQSVTLQNTGTSTLTISGLGASGDFATATTCGTSLAASASCTINVTFAPQSGGLKNETLTVTDDAAGSPHTVVLTGTGMAGLTKLSTDTFTNATSYHATEVEPDTFAYGSKIVSVFQVGRFIDGGASAIGFATSLDGGTTWSHGYLPGITKLQDSANSYDRVSDPTIAYDAFHGVWLAASLPISGTSVIAPDIIVNRSMDGLNWGNPVLVNSTPGNYDKSWIACDNWTGSPYYGNCYVEWDSPGQFNRIFMSTSNDGGLTWGPMLTTANFATGLGGQPLALPNGIVAVPIGNAYLTSILSYVSNDGGTSWSSTSLVSGVSEHPIAGNLRSSVLPSAEIDGAGKIYLVWQDCRFRNGCFANPPNAPNDIVMSTSTDGLTWSAPARIPIDDLTSTVDHFIPGIAVDTSTSGATAHLGLTYYYYPNYNCTAATCQLYVGYISSDDGGTTWSAPTELAGPMNLSALPQTSQGVMVGDYISTSFVNGLAFGAFAVANPVSGLVFDEAIYTTAIGLSHQKSLVRRSSAGEKPVANIPSVTNSSLAPKKIR